MTGPVPRIDARDWDGILQALEARVPGYLPAWRPAADRPGEALLRIFSRYMELLGDGLNAVPDRTRLAFLARTGVSLLPAQPARVPLVFQLVDTCPLDVTLPANTQVAVPAAEVLPSSLEGDVPAAPPQAVPFATTRAVTLARAKLTALYSLDPDADAYADHSAGLTTGFKLFDGFGPVPHELYCGHDKLFALAGVAEVTLSFDMAPMTALGSRRGVVLDWEYLSADGWLPLRVVDDTTARFTDDGKITLAKDCGPDAKQDTIAGRTSYWLRGRVRATPPAAFVRNVAGAELTLDATWPFLVGDRVTADGEIASSIQGIFGRVVVLDAPLPGAAIDGRVRLLDALPPLRPEGSDTAGLFPRVDRIIARVGFSQTGLRPDKAFGGPFLLDPDSVFYPFGRQPEPFATFAVGCKAAFQLAGAKVRIDVVFATPGVSTGAKLDWEYSTADGWKAFVNPSPVEDGTAAFTANGGITFLAPADWAATKLNGEENYWVRCRLASGGYGHPFRLKVDTTGGTTTVTAEEDTLKPPAVAKLTVGYTYYTNSLLLDHCVTANGFVFADHSDDCRWPRRTFDPFAPVEDREPAVHLGFDRQLPTGLVGLHVEMPGEQADGSAGELLWEYRSARGWTELGLLDETRSFRQSGLIQFIGPADAVATPGVGGELFRLRARLPRGVRPTPLPVAGVWMNAVRATQRTVVENEVVGTSEGGAIESFPLLRQGGAVLEGERVEVREWTGRGDGWQTAVLGVPPADLVLVRDPGTGEPVEAWVRWSATTRPYAQGPADGVYGIERSEGVLRFGDGGRVPAAGMTVRLSYSSGGGTSGNVPAGAVHELRSGVPYVQAVTNPVPAAGGAEAEAVSAVRRRGSEGLRHHDRGVSARDVEWLAREASAGVARVRCLDLAGPEGHAQRGWFTLIVVPHGGEARPLPTAELGREIRTFLATRLPAVVGERVRVVPPRYAPVSVAAEVVPLDPAEAVGVEERVRTGLRNFLHPLTGGPAGRGWDFGEGLYLSQIAALIEGTPGVDYAASIRLSVEEALFEEAVPVGRDSLVCCGDLELKLSIGVAP